MPTVAGLHYFFHEGGSHSRPSLVLVHGAGLNHLFWPPEVRRFAGYRVYALDLPGHGKSEGTGLQFVSDYARSVVNFMNSVGLSKAVIVGHSIGGAIALTMALDHAGRVAGIVLLGAGARMPIPPAILESTSNPAAFPFAIQAIQDRNFGPQANVHLKEQAAKYMKITRPTVVHGDFLACDKFDVADRLGELRVPTLVLRGTKDTLTPLQSSETLASQIPGAALQTIDGAGHLMMLEQPRRVAALLNVFLSTISYQPGM